MKKEDVDFEYWEKRYGRALSEFERLEFKGNLLAPLSIIDEAYQEKPNYFNGFLDGIKKGHEEMARELTPPLPTQKP